MKKPGFLVCLLVVAAATRAAAFDAPASLADAAKKEAERREKAKKAGAATRTLTEEDLASAKGTLANTPAGKGSPAPTTAGGKDHPGMRVTEVPDEAPTEGARGEDYWRGRVGAARARVEGAQRRLDALQAMIRFGQPGQRGENGRITIYSAQDMKAMADSAAAELAAAQAELETVLEDGRHAGALPGWLR
jgi:hypothetical protein